MKRPAFQFYPADWRKDAALQACSGAARGLWIELMCIMHECDPYGHAVVNGKPMTTAQIARLAGFSLKECTNLLGELIEAGVASHTVDGAIFSRRMVRDEKTRNARAQGGEAGSEHGIKGAEHGLKGGRPRKTTADKKPPLYPPPSSSTSSSASTDTSSLRSDVTRARKEPFQLPHWIPEEPWSAFVEMRQKTRAPLTERAMKLAVTSLKELHAAGEDVTAVLNQSVMRSWRGLFPVKQEGSHGHGRQPGEGKQTRALGNFLEETRNETGNDAGRGTTSSPVPSERRALPLAASESDDNERAFRPASDGDGRNFSAPEQHDGSGIDAPVSDILRRSTWAV